MTKFLIFYIFDALLCKTWFYPRERHDYRSRKSDDFYRRHDIISTSQTGIREMDNDDDDDIQRL